MKEQLKFAFIGFIAGLTLGILLYYAFQKGGLDSLTIKAGLEEFNARKLCVVVASPSVK